MQYFPLCLERIEKTPQVYHTNAAEYTIHGTLIGCPIVMILYITEIGLSINIRHHPNHGNILTYDHTTNTPYITHNDDAIRRKVHANILFSTMIPGDYTHLDPGHNHEHLDTINTIITDALNTMADPIHLHRIIIWTLLVHTMAEKHTLDPQEVYTLWPGRQPLDTPYGTQCIYPYRSEWDNIISVEDTARSIQSSWTISGVAGSDDMLTEWDALYLNHGPTGYSSTTIAALCAAAKAVNIPLNHPLLSEVNIQDIDPYDINPVLLSMHEHRQTTRHTTTAIHPDIHPDIALPLVHERAHRTYDNRPSKRIHIHDGWIHGMPASIIHSCYELDHAHNHHTRVIMLQPTILPAWDIISHQPQSPTRAYTGYPILHVRKSQWGKPTQYLPGYNPCDNMFPLRTTIPHPARLDTIITILVYLVLKQQIPAPPNIHTISTPLLYIKYIDAVDTDWILHTDTGAQTLWTDMFAALEWAGIPIMHYSTHTTSWELEHTSTMLNTHIYNTLASMSQHDTIPLYRAIHTISNTGIPTLPIGLPITTP